MRDPDVKPNLAGDGVQRIQNAPVSVIIGVHHNWRPQLPCDQAAMLKGGISDIGKSVEQ